MVYTRIPNGLLGTRKKVPVRRGINQHRESGLIVGDVGLGMYVFVVMYFWLAQKYQKI